MCGRYVISSSPDAIRATFGYGERPNFPPRYNVAPTQPVPIVRMIEGKRSFALMRWGFVPGWVKDPKTVSLMINARGESVNDKPAFRNAMRRRRCLVPADGFFEWANKTPLYIHPRDRRVVAFAGLWARAKTDAGELHSFTIITGKPNALVAPIHDRMPIVLDRSAWAAWLDPSVDSDGARALLAVPPIGDWRAEAVSTWVNKADHDDPRCIEPADSSQRPLVLR